MYTPIKYYDQIYSVIYMCTHAWKKVKKEAYDIISNSIICHQIWLDILFLKFKLPEINNSFKSVINPDYLMIRKSNLSNVVSDYEAKWREFIINFTDLIIYILSHKNILPHYLIEIIKFFILILSHINIIFWDLYQTYFCLDCWATAQGELDLAHRVFLVGSEALEFFIKG